MNPPVRSWNGYPSAAGTPERLRRPPTLDSDLASCLAHGMGRSYGDVCLNPGGALLLTRALDRFQAFDTARGVIRCEAGVTLDEVIRVTLPQGWFPAVVPGTAQVTVGGAVANDVHGKNHHQAGTFGHHVLALGLLRSDGQTLRCSADENPDMFRATVGGLGLTGLITWVEFALHAMPTATFEAETHRFSGFQAFVDLSLDSAQDWPYTAAWVDSTAQGRQLGRGVFHRARAAKRAMDRQPRKRSLTMPFMPPVNLVSKLGVRAFNALYFARSPSRPSVTRAHPRPFLFPLDGVAHWYRMYGPAGFLQYQCVVPYAASAAIPELLNTVAESGKASFLTVLKAFGEQPAAGLLSFPRPGITLAMDFPGTGAAVHALFQRLDTIVMAAGGALYPAKDARMSPEMFRHSFPLVEQFMSMKDPKFSSGFWRRVMPGYNG